MIKYGDITIVGSSNIFAFYFLVNYAVYLIFEWVCSRVLERLM